MSLSPEFLELVCAALANGNAAQPDIDRRLRDSFPGINFALCSDNDIPSRIKPLAQGEGFALYGIQTSQHCASLTMQAEAASGIAIALISEED